ncbi:MAG: hypothetical protein C0462_12600 [Alcanivorax sp.]|nr:hypothetical protein [Alcanivorax sp.]
MIHTIRKMSPLLCGPLLWFGAAPVHAAGGHYAVDDATLVDPGRCQLEAWYTHADSNNRSVTALPACNVTGNLELTLGMAREWLEDGNDTEVEFAGKTLLRDMEEGGIGVALSVATFWRNETDHFEAVEVVLPVSVPVNDRLLTHVNVGWGRERGEQDDALWGVGAELDLVHGISLIGETYGSHRGGTRLGAGLRYGIGPVDLDLAWDRSRAERRDDAVIAGFAVAF